MPLLTPAELAAARDDAAALLTQSGTRLAYAETQDGLGGRTPRWSPAEAIPCRVERTRREAAETQRGGAVRLVEQYACLLRPGDVALFGSRDRLQVDGTTYEVAGVTAGEADQILAALDLTRVEGV